MKFKPVEGRTVSAGFDEEKSAQMAAYLAQQSREPTDKLKLIKLIYLSEREYLDRHLMPMTFDEFYSFKDGPVASAALNGIDGQLNVDLWQSWISVDANKVTAVTRRPRDDFDHLSEADLDVLKAIWDKFGSWSTSRIWKYVHNKENVPEYTPVERGRLPIAYEDILRALKKADADDIAQEIKLLQREAALL